MTLVGAHATISLRTRLGETVERIICHLWRSPTKLPMGYPELELLSVLGEEGCPICHTRARSDDQYFFGFLYEGYFETEALEYLTKSLGFCLMHGAQLVGRYNSPSPMALVHKWVAEHVRRVLLAEQTRKTWIEEIIQAGGSMKTCPACRSFHDGEVRLASFFSRVLDEEEARDQYSRPGTLCMPHLRMVAPCLAEARLKELLEIHSDVLLHAMSDLDKAQQKVVGANSDAIARGLRLAVGHDRATYSHFRMVPPKELGDGHDPVRRVASALSHEQTCPVCSELHRAWNEWSAWVDRAAQQNEDINDVLPLCPSHAWGLVRRASSRLTAAARVLQEGCRQIKMACEAFAPAPPIRVLELVRTPVKVLTSRGAPGSKATAILVRQPYCPMCWLLSKVTDRTLELIFALLENRNHRDAFDRGHGLCMRHFVRALTLRPQPQVLDMLVAVHRARLALTIWELEEFSRKRAWHARPESKGSEQNAPSRAVLRFSGTWAKELLNGVHDKPL